MIPKAEPLKRLIAFRVYVRLPFILELFGLGKATTNRTHKKYI
jgi:hypothetical protein